MADATTDQGKLTVTVTMQHLDRATVEISCDQNLDRRRLVALNIGDQYGGYSIQFLDDLEHVAAVIHRADVMLQAHLQMAPAEVGL